MVEIVFNQTCEGAEAKVFIATKDESLNYGVTGGLIERSAFNRLKAFVEREDEINGVKKDVLAFDGDRGLIVLIRVDMFAKAVELQRAAAKVYSRVKKQKTVCVYARHLPKTDFGAKDVACNLGFGFELAAYSFDKYKTLKKDCEYDRLEKVNFVGKEKLDKVDYADMAALANAVRYARDLTNEPANALTPAIYAADIKRLEHLGLKVTVMDKTELKKKGFNMLLSVAEGSVNEPFVCVIEHWGNKKKKTVDAALVGKGVTFDSGGISIKPAAGMWEMKQDMAGSAVVAASLKACAQQKMPLNVVGIVGLVENMPSGSATKPGDIVTSLSGKTVEILNTDAEGRLVLGDCLTYVEREFSPERIVDLATLTGAIVVALGSEMAGLFSNDDCLSELLSISGEQSGEEVWRFPLNDRYRDMIKSDIADLKNISDGRAAGSITAACFLESFLLKKTPWAHLDIAGMDMFSKPKPMYGKGASGFGVMLINKFLSNISATR